MPRLRKQSHRRRTAYTYYHVWHLMSGIDFFGDGFGCGNFNDAFRPEDARAGWRVLRDEILEFWIQHYPGTRCWGWWKFDAAAQRFPDEKQRDYLDRLGLLEADERARLADNPSIYCDNPWPPMLHEWPLGDTPTPAPAPSADDPGQDDDDDGFGVGHA